MNAYVLVDEVKTELGITEPDYDEMIREKCETASRLWDVLTKRRFYPVVATRYYDYRFQYTLHLNDDLLEVTTLTTGNGASTMSAAAYWPMTGSSYGDPPYARIVSTSPLSCIGTTRRAHAVTGIWGYHNDWANAWRNSGDTVKTNITAGATSVAVTDVDGTDAAGYDPRFQEGQLLRIGTEYLHLQRKNATTDTLTIERGVNGSTAAAHTALDMIYVYQPMRQIRQAAKRLAAWLFRIKDSQVFSTIAFPEMGTIEIPEGLPADVVKLIPFFRRVTL